jgi:hypothetical protein
MCINVFHSCLELEATKCISLKSIPPYAIKLDAFGSHVLFNPLWWKQFNSLRRIREPMWWELIIY